MAKDLLTREELSLLLADDPAPTDGRASLPELDAGPFSPEDFAALQKILATYLIPGVTAWSVLFGRAVELADPEISLVTAAALTEMRSAAVGEVDFISGLKGRARFVLPMAGARVLVGLALGSPEPPQEFDLIHRSSFASVLKYLLAEMRSLIARGTGKRVGTSEPIIKLWPEEVVAEGGHLMQAKIRWWVDGVENPGLLFWADLELTRGLLGLTGPKAKTTRSPGESAWMGEAPRGGSKAATLGGGRGFSAAGDAGSAVPKGLGRLGAGKLKGGVQEKPAAERKVEEPAARSAPAAKAAPAAGDELSIWTLGRARADNAAAAPATRIEGPAPKPVASAAPVRAADVSRDVELLAPARVEPARSAAPEPVRAATPVEPPPAPVAAAPRIAPPAPQGPPRDPDEHEVRVELGRGTIRKALALGQVVSLDRLAGESVDIFVDGQLAARGEVTVEEEVLAVRVTQTIAHRRDR